MSAILSTEDLNDFITPGVACIKPVETLPAQQPDNASSNPYEVTTEDRVEAANAPPASISLTDCLACSGCVTSAEAVLVSLQSHAEVLNTLDVYPELIAPWNHSAVSELAQEGKIFVASVSPQSRASIAATYGVSEREAGNMIHQLLSGPHGLRSGGRHGSGFTWVIDTNVMRQVALVAAADEVRHSFEDPTDVTQLSKDRPRRPILTSACPGWICYAEKTHPHILPHISRVKSPQALTGTLLKSVLAKSFGVSPDRIWHVAVMPCFDKKLEASRAELTDLLWRDGDKREAKDGGIRDVDCVITARELLMLADSRSISFPALPRTPLSKQDKTPFPDAVLDRFLFPPRTVSPKPEHDSTSLALQTGTSGGYLWHILRTMQAEIPGSSISVKRGRNADVADYALDTLSSESNTFRAARYYGFRNIQNLVRKLKPARQSRVSGAVSRSARALAAGAADNMTQYAYVEVMACPGGCTNGGGQIKFGDVEALRGTPDSASKAGDLVVAPSQKAWLGMVDEAYFSAESGSDCLEDQDGDSQVDADGEDKRDNTDFGFSTPHVKSVMDHWAQITGVGLDQLVYTTYRRVESDVGKKKVGDAERVAGLASSIGGGW